MSVFTWILITTLVWGTICLVTTLFDGCCSNKKERPDRRLVFLMYWVSPLVFALAFVFALMRMTMRPFQ